MIRHPGTVNSLSTWHNGHCSVKITEESKLVEIKLNPNIAHCFVVIRVKNGLQGSEIGNTEREHVCFLTLCKPFT